MRISKYAIRAQREHESEHGFGSWDRLGLDEQRKLALRLERKEGAA